MRGTVGADLEVLSTHVIFFNAPRLTDRRKIVRRVTRVPIRKFSRIPLFGGEVSLGVLGFRGAKGKLFVFFDEIPVYISKKFEQPSGVEDLNQLLREYETWTSMRAL